MRVATIIVTVSLLILVLIPMSKGDTTLTLEHKESFTIYTNTLEHPVGLAGSDSGYNITNGDKLFVSWKVTENSLLLPPIVWLLTKVQRNHFSQTIGGPSLAYGYILKTTAWEGNFLYAITQNGTYYVIFHNLNWGALDINGPTLNAEVYNAVLTIPALPPPTPPPTPPSAPVGGYSVSIEGHSTPSLSLYLIALIMLSSTFISTKRKMRKT
jgi:hypothetical protein